MYLHGTVKWLSWMENMFLPTEVTCILRLRRTVDKLQVTGSQFDLPSHPT